MTAVMEQAQPEIVLTAGGRAHIEDELNKLVTVDRHEVADRIRDAKDYGDLNENSEYEAAKNAQAFVEGRILDLKSILSRARLLNDEEIPSDRVGLGSQVTVRDLDFGDEWAMTLVSAFEADPDKDRISTQSPIGLALLNKVPGDKVEVKTPGGTSAYQVVSIGK